VRSLFGDATDLKAAATTVDGQVADATSSGLEAAAYAAGNDDRLPRSHVALRIVDDEGSRACDDHVCDVEFLIDVLARPLTLGP
jgi:hypothetical protein